MKLDIEPSQRVLIEVLELAVTRHPQRTFLQFDSGDLTYASFHEACSRVAGGLARFGLAAGGKVAIMLPNCREFVLTWFGGAMLGAAYVPINTEYRGAILAHQLRTAEVTHMVVDSAYVDRVLAVLNEVPMLRRVFVRGAAVQELPADPELILDEFQSLEASESMGSPVKGRYTDPLAIAFTSGTTGPSKGVLATNCHVVTFAMDWVRAVRFPEGGAIYSPLPLFHAIAAWLGLVPAMLVGGRIAFAERFSASAYWDEVRRVNADVAHGVFAMVPILLKQPVRANDADQPARIFYTGRRHEEFERRFNCLPIEVYGSTETGIVTMTPEGEAPLMDSSGRVNAESFTVIIGGPDDQPLAAGEVGEILIRSNRPYAMFNEYYGMPEATVAVFRNQWFHTGDSARMDAQGHLYFVDRLKDTIRRRGENISSYEIESALLRHPDVIECAAVAVKSEVSEDDVKVVVVERAGAKLTAEALWAFCEANMPRFWVPRFIEFRDGLPKTANHKVQKYQLRSNDGCERLHER